MSCFAFWSLSVIKEAAILKKHNLFEDNMALPSESVSSLTDIKTSAGSNQASPARRASALLPGVSDSETLSNEVFQESGEKKQPGVSSPLAKEESLSFPVPTPPPVGTGQMIISGMDGPLVDLVTAEDTAGALGTHSSELEFGGAPKDGEPTHEKPESSSASSSLKELRNLLTVTIEVPVESSTLEIEEDTNEETLAPQEMEKLEETTPTYTEANQAAASSQDSCEESEISGREAHPPPLEAEASREELGGFLGAELAREGLNPGASSPDPTEQQAEAGEPTEGEIQGRSSSLDAQDERGAASIVEDEARPQEDCTSGAHHTCPSESPVSVEETLGGTSSMTQATTSVKTEEIKAAGVHECQWVVENAPNIDLLGSPDLGESTPEQPSEE